MKSAAQKLILFVHGINSNVEAGFGDLTTFLEMDNELKGYDIKHFNYQTSFFKKTPSLKTIVEYLFAEFQAKCSAYKDVTFLCHSQGGLVIKRFLSDTEKAGKLPPLVSLFTFATPHIGSGLAHLSQLIRWNHQLRDLSPSSEFLYELHKDWANLEMENKITSKHFEAGEDWVVNALSAANPNKSNHTLVLPNEGHISLPKPKDESALIVLLIKQLLKSPVSRIERKPRKENFLPPLLERKSLKESGSNRFRYDVQVTKFVAREKEMQQLQAFLDKDEQFQFMIVHGSGGMGKSRLCFELAQNIYPDWYGGFMSEPVVSWREWQVLHPTCMIIDYAAKDKESVKGMLDAFSKRDDLAYPVRIILIEREGEKGNWAEGLINDKTKGFQFASLNIDEFTGGWELAKSLFQDKLPITKQEFLTEFLRIDKERRPLFAFLMADSLLKGGKAQDFTKYNLLENILLRWRNEIWKTHGITIKDERLLAFATMTGGLTVEQIKRLHKEEAIEKGFFPKWKQESHIGKFNLLSSYQDESISPLEPDILGEFYVLWLFGDERYFTKRQIEAVVQLAWEVNALSYALFMNRTTLDLIDNIKIAHLFQIPSSKNNQNPENRHVWSAVSFNFITHLGYAGHTIEAEIVYKALTRMCKIYPSEFGLVLEWSKSSVNLVGFLTLNNQINDAIDVCNELLEVAKYNKVVRQFWHHWADSYYNFIRALCMLGELGIARQYYAKHDFEITKIDYPSMIKDWEKLRVWLFQ